MTERTASAPIAVEQGGRLDPHINRVLWMLLFAVFVTFFNEMAMSVAIPKIVEDLRITPSTGQWLTTGYALTMAVVIPLTGWILQRLNTRPVYFLALALFVAGTIIGLVAPNFELLLLARIVQASGTALMMPLMMTTTLMVVPPNFRGQIMGRSSLVMSLAPAAGPAISGIILTFLHWRWLFVLILPLAVIMLVLGSRVPNVGDPKKTPLDFLSLILSAIAFSSIVYGLSSVGLAAEGHAALPPWLPLIVGAVFLVAFVLRQLRLQRRDAALLDLRTFKHRPFTLSLLIMGCAMLSLFGASILMPFFIQNVLGFDPYVVGLTMLPGSLLMAFGGPFVGRLYDRIGAFPIVLPGAILVSSAFWLFAFVLNPETPIWGVLAIQLLMSLGLVGIFSPLFAAGLSSLEPRLYSHGSATFGTAQQVFGAAGAAVFVAAFAIATANGIDAGVSEVVAQADGIRSGFLIGAVASLGMIAMAALMPRGAPSAAPHGAPAAH
jgi:DHA2 family lincomycin resistance protein-like MFS transporter